MESTPEPRKSSAKPGTAARTPRKGRFREACIPHAYPESPRSTLSTAPGAILLCAAPARRARDAARPATVSCRAVPPTRPGSRGGLKRAPEPASTSRRFGDLPDHPVGGFLGRVRKAFPHWRGDLRPRNLHVVRRRHLHCRTPFLVERHSRRVVG